jgi:hypothetical protein
MTNTIKSLCNSCKKNCTSNLKTEFALRKNLTYIYLHNGNKIINGCSQYSGETLQTNLPKLAMQAIEQNTQIQPPKLSFSGSLNLESFKSLASKI